MATTFPDQIQGFIKKKDVEIGDASKLKQFQDAMEAGNFTLAKSILSTISDYDAKIITADYFNTMSDTLLALQNYFLKRYSPAYIVSETQPASQEVGDFWIKVVS